ncbi:MAG: GIY-YIG nuclease family protein [Patescibacteria group bacterium]|nr:GIY-YIG nuclease family protein [Patescibacteria group bacterium]
MNRQYLNKLKVPEKPGIYVFRDYAKRPLYIGRATSLRDRLKSYFANDLIETRGARIADMVAKAKYITWEITDSVLEAVILESRLIKRYQPYYNVDERDDRSSQYLIITDEEWPRIFLMRARDFEHHSRNKTLAFAVRACYGPFINTGIIIECLKIMRRMFPFRDKKALDRRHETFYRSIGKSPDMEKVSHLEYMRNIRFFQLFFEGRKKTLRKVLEADMKTLAKDMHFEEANRMKKLLYAIDHINDISLLKRSEKHSRENNRIEAYDIAHMSGKNVVGAMVVMIGGEVAKNEYRKFKIGVDKNDDLRNLAEILSRRLNHPEWDLPDIIVVDGNENQVKVAESILKSRRMVIPVIGVTKDDRHKAVRLIGDAALCRKFRQNIVAVNAEAHRFAMAFHRYRRGRDYVVR